MPAVATMAYENDVRRSRDNLNDSARYASNDRSKVNSLVDGANQWWKGKGGEAFINGYNDIDKDVDRFLKSIAGAVDGLNRLPSLIQRAERERREAKK
jgi:uncharacterized protein YukE